MPSDIKGQISTMQKLQLLLHQPNNCLSHLIPVSATVSCSKTDFSKSRQSPQIFHISLKVHSEIFLFKIPVLLLVLFVTKQNKNLCIFKKIGIIRLCFPAHVSSVIIISCCFTVILLL